MIKTDDMKTLAERAKTLRTALVEAGFAPDRAERAAEAFVHQEIAARYDAKLLTLFAATGANPFA